MTKQDLMHLGKYERSLVDHVAAFKMMLLLKMQYICTMPIPLPSYFFQSKNADIKRFLCKGKKLKSL